MPHSHHTLMRERIASACLDLIRIPSVTGDETAIADFLEAWAKKAKFPVIRHSNALIVGAPDAQRPTVALVGHTDTVPAHPSDGDAFQDGDRIVGLGTSDMKGSLAVMQVLFETLTLDALPFNLMLNDDAPTWNAIACVFERLDTRSPQPNAPTR